MLGSSALPNFPVDVRAGPGLSVQRRGTAVQIEIQETVLPALGRGNEYTVTTASGIVSLRDGLRLTVRPDRANIGDVRMNVDGTGFMPVLDAGGSEVPGGHFLADRVASMTYDGRLGAWRMDGGLAAATAIAFDYSGTFAQRALYDREPKGKTFLAISETPVGPSWVLYLKRSDTPNDWSSGLPIKASPAQSTADAQAAAEAAAKERDRAQAEASAAQAQAQASAAARDVAGGHALNAGTQAQTAQSAANEATQLARLVGALSYDMGSLDQPSDGSTNFDFGAL